MRYRIDSSTVIRTENAAKPRCQRSKHLERFIRDLPKVETSFDLGCGKLRYADAIAASSATVTLIDSEIQLSRQQEIQPHGQTTIRSAMSGSNHMRVENLKEFRKGRSRFDRGFCLNVLPIIPSAGARRRLLESVKSNLKPGADCIFSVHYHNKEFRKLASLPNSRPYNDGFIVDSLRGPSFFAVLKPDMLRSILREAGFDLGDHLIINGAIYQRATA